MSGDKRSVSTDALETLGTIIDERAGRDAIHLAVEPVVADIRLFPGQDVGLDASGHATSMVPPLGIVDPFLKQPVQPGERFWLIVYPRQITSLRHVWTHPEFPESSAANPAMTSSEIWLRGWCSQSGVATYEQFIQAVKTGSSGKLDEPYGDFYGLTFDDGRFCTCGYENKEVSIPNEFWDHLEVVTGQKFRTRTDYFSCSC